MTKMFQDRREAGRELAKRLVAFRGADDVVVLGLPRGGVPVAAEVAEFLGVPLGIQLVRKLGVPGEPELAMGAIASGGFGLAVVLTAHLPELPRDQAEALVRAAHEVCPYSNATRGNIQVDVKVA